MEKTNRQGILPASERVAKLIEEYLIPVIVEHIREGKIKPDLDFIIRHDDKS